MGYELHIVRRNSWDDYDEESNISLEEWLAFVESDNELELVNRFPLKTPNGEDMMMDSPGFCYWTAHSTKVGGQKPWLDYGFGRISTRHLDDETIRKMMSIAEKLNGKVQGDDGEFYDESYFLNKSNKVEPDAMTQLEKKPWWKFW